MHQTESLEILNSLLWCYFLEPCMSQTNSLASQYHVFFIHAMKTWKFSQQIPLIPIVPLLPHTYNVVSTLFPSSPIWWLKNFLAIVSYCLSWSTKKTVGVTITGKRERCHLDCVVILEFPVLFTEIWSLQFWYFFFFSKYFSPHHRM